MERVARDGAVVRAIASHQCGPGSNSRRRRHMWVEFVVGSLSCSKRFFSGYFGFPLSSKTKVFKFQFDQESGRLRTTLWMCYLQTIIVLLFYYLFIYFMETKLRTFLFFFFFRKNQQNLVESLLVLQNNGSKL